MSIPLPRPVGIASETESLIVELTEAIEPNEARKRLARQVPAEITVTGARMLEPGRRPVPVEARYRLAIGANPPPDLQARIDRLLRADVVHVSRFSPKLGRTRDVDVRPYLISMRVDGEDVEFTLRLTQSGGAKPAEIAGRLGYDPDAVNHRICRMEVRWQ
jgi:radical SAM-linked protein